MVSLFRTAPLSIPAYTIFSLETAQKLNGLAAAHGCVQPVHIKIDTGMSRIGFSAEEASVEPIVAIDRMENLQITGAFTHFARADEPDGQAADRQFRAYRLLLERLEV